MHWPHLLQRHSSSNVPQTSQHLKQQLAQVAPAPIDATVDVEPASRQSSRPLRSRSSSKSGRPFLRSFRSINIRKTIANEEGDLANTTESGIVQLKKSNSEHGRREFGALEESSEKEQQPQGKRELQTKRKRPLSLSALSVAKSRNFSSHSPAPSPSPNPAERKSSVRPKPVTSTSSVDQSSVPRSNGSSKAISDPTNSTVTPLPQLSLPTPEEQPERLSRAESSQAPSEEPPSPSPSSIETIKAASTPTPHSRATLAPSPTNSKPPHSGLFPSPPKGKQSAVRTMSASGARGDRSDDTPRVAFHQLRPDEEKEDVSSSSRDSLRPPGEEENEEDYTEGSQLFKRENMTLSVGNQTLLQMLNAITTSDSPAYDDDSDEASAHTHLTRTEATDTDDTGLTRPSSEAGEVPDIKEERVSSGESESEMEDGGEEGPMHSSINAIHRPIAHSRRGTAASRRPTGLGIIPPVAESDEEEAEAEEYARGRSQESEDEDDEYRAALDGTLVLQKPLEVTGDEPVQRPVAPDEAPSTVKPSPSQLQDPGLLPVPMQVPRSRGTSALSDKDKRVHKLAEKLMEIFGLPEKEKVVGEYPCWLFRSLLLQGYLYITSGHICFYAYLPRREGQVVRSGSLSKRGATSRRYFKHWFVLKDAVFSWYPSSTEPYFPDGDIDLHYCTAVEKSAAHDTHFKIGVANKKFHFAADSRASRDEWVKTIRKELFRCQNEGESVKISIPLETVVDVEQRSNFCGTSIVHLRVCDAEEGYSLDDYWFSYMSDPEAMEKQIVKAIDDFKILHPEQSATADAAMKASRISDSTGLKAGPPGQPGQASGLDAPLTTIKSEPGPQPTLQRSTTWTAKLNPFSKQPEEEPPKSQEPNKEFHNKALYGKLRKVTSPRTPSYPQTSHTYPPDPAPGEPPAGLSEPNFPVKDFSQAWRLPSSWIPKRLSAPTAQGQGGRRVASTVSRHGQRKSSSSPEARSSGEGLVDQSYAFLDKEIQEEPDELVKAVDEKLKEKFRSHFSLPEKDGVIAHCTAYLFRGLPIIGKIYLSHYHLCFRSTGILTNTKMVLPLGDVLTVQKHRALRPGLNGMVVVIKGHEEVFFEIAGAERRDQAMLRLEQQVDIVRKERAEDEPEQSEEQKEALQLQDLELEEAASDSRPPPENISERMPAVMFKSTSSSFVTFRPEKSLKFLCLTIGSRGDVQPYIALAKGLIAEGHQVKIASHGEYRAWVEGHGVEFAECGGDPAELMKLSVDNGMFSMSFLREGVAKFRGWLDDLLKSAWEACQGSDVLIESPSTMAGIHIAEALQIPYFRAFTMPWTRTRAYPHAFAVPDHKMGGGYNYMTYTLIDTVFWKATAGQINRWRKNLLDLPPTNAEKMEAHKVPFLYNFSTALVPPPLDWHEWVHVTGYWNLENPEDSKTNKWTPPDDLVKFLDRAKADNKKVVYIGFGSIVVSDPVTLTKTVVEGVEKAGVMAIVSKGWSDRMLKKDTEQAKQEQQAQDAKEESIMDHSSIYNVKSIPHDWLFPRIHAVCHHGGAGTTGASLRNGLPTIIRPFFGDQFFWAERVEAMGIGLAAKKLTVESLTHALKATTTDEKMIGRAKAVGEQLRAENGVATAIETIYRDLPYAQSLVYKKRQQPPAPKRTGTDNNNNNGLQSISSSQSSSCNSNGPGVASKAGNDTNKKNKPSRGSSSNSKSMGSVSGGGKHRPPPLTSSQTSTTSSWDVLSSRNGGGIGSDEDEAGDGDVDDDDDDDDYEQRTEDFSQVGSEPNSSKGGEKDEDGGRGGGGGGGSGMSDSDVDMVSPVSATFAAAGNIAANGGGVVGVRESESGRATPSRSASGSSSLLVKHKSMLERIASPMKAGFHCPTSSKKDKDEKVDGGDDEEEKKKMVTSNEKGAATTGVVGEKGR